MLIESITLAVDFISKTFQLSDGSIVNCLIYDTCGQERYNSINESYFRKADAALLVYDISLRKTFDSIKDYYCPKIKEFCKKNIPIILLGNKADKENLREIQPEEGAELALKEKYKFKETSCLKNVNVADAFEALIELWNIEALKRKILTKNRRPSLDKKNEKEKNNEKEKEKENENEKEKGNKLIKSNTVYIKKENDNELFNYDKNIVLNKKKHSQKKKKKRKKFC